MRIYRLGEMSFALFRHKYLQGSAGAFMSNKADGGKWYSGGLRFCCLRCGRCCRGEPGYVWVQPDEVRAMAKASGMDVGAFLKRYCRNVGGRISLIEYAGGDCVFFSPSGCMIYPSRPRQCRTFPFWPHLLASKTAWEKEKKRCPGIGRGPLFKPEDIEAVTSGRQ